MKLFRQPLSLILLLASLTLSAGVEAASFRRGDANADAGLDISDAIVTLGYLFNGGPAPSCLDAADSDDDGELAISDAIRLLGVLFFGDGVIPFPGPGDGCGEDLTADSLDCDAYEPCGVPPEVHSPGGSGDIRKVLWILPEAGESFEVTYELIDGLAVAEGDIVLGTEEDFLGNGTAGGLSVRAGRQFRWPNGVIPFNIEERTDGHSWDNAQVVETRIRSAIAHWNQNTSIRLVQRTNETAYVAFVASDGCSSAVGMQGKRQVIRVLDRVNASGQAEFCSIGNIIHEIGHAVGLWHEVSRCDRDEWVQILPQNIQEGQEHNFEKLCPESLDVGPYDYGSIMHYGATGFGIVTNGIARTTIQPLQPLPPGVTLGQRNGLSAGDIAGVNQIYAGPQIWVEDFAYVVGSWRVDRHPRVLADVNGDGRKDIVGFGDRGVIVSLAAATGNGFTPPGLWVEAFAPLAGGWQVDLHPRLLGDINGDRMDDIVGFGQDGVWVSLSTGTSFTDAGYWLADFGVASGWRTDLHLRMLADLNGDGRQDIVGFGGPGVLVSLSTGNGFTQPTFWLEAFTIDQGGWQVDRHPRMLADINGDGLPDIVGFGEEGVWVSTSTGNGFTEPGYWLAEFGASAGGWRIEQHPRMLGDMNGDGRQDIVGFAEDGVWVSLSLGYGLAQPQRWIDDYGYQAGGWRVGQHPRMLADVNGDGRQDVVGFANEGVFVSISNGDGLRQSKMWIDDFGYTAGGWRTEKHLRLVGDITGDGKADIAAFGDYGVFVQRSGTPVSF